MQTQLDVSDVVFYLISLRGPSAEDIALIKNMISNGKTIYVIINKYDEDVDLALETYREDLEDAGYTGELYLASALKKRGLETLKKLVQDIVSRQDEILQKRCTTIFQQLLEQELVLLNEESNLFNLSFSDDSASVQRKLNEQRALITQFKADLRKAKQEKWKELSNSFSACKQQEATRFKDTLNALNTDALIQNYTDQSWNKWLDTLKILINESTTRLIQNLPETEDWFDASIVSKMDALDIPPPYLPDVKSEEFREAAKMQELKMEISTLEQDETDFPEHNLELMQSVLKEHQEKYQLISSQHTDVMNEDVPMIERQDGLGSKIGSAIGNMADIGLLFVNPTTAGTKIAGWLGKGSKLSSTIINAGKTAQLIKQTDSIKKASTTIGKAVELSLKMRKKNILTTMGLPIIEDKTLDKKIQKSGVGKMVGVLEKLSVGYWGKKIGGIFDKKYLVEDPVAAAKKVEQLNLLNTELTTIQTSVTTLERGIFEAEGNEIKKRRLQMKLEQKQAQLQKKTQEMQQWEERKTLEAKERKERIVGEAIQQSLQRSIHRLEARLLGLETELHKRFTKAYKELNKTSIQERTAHYDAIEAELCTSLEEKQQRLEEITSQISLLQSFQRQ